MKINANHPSADSEAKKNQSDRQTADRRRRQILSGRTEAAEKYQPAENPLKNAAKFAGILDAAAKPPIAEQTRDDAKRQRGDDKNDGKHFAREDNAAETPAGNDRIERHNFSGGGYFGGGGFGEGQINQTINLSDNFAARSILHIADLERIISSVRTQTARGGRREISLELKRSVLKGLKVKIVTDAARSVEIEFIAAGEKVRSQIENHSEELTEILRGRGINLKSLRTSLAAAANFSAT